MNILTIDTANEYLSLAIQANTQIYTFQEKIGNKQSEQILPQIQILLEQAKIALNDIQLIAYNQGPGSFTGLRIGLSIALGLAYSLNCQLVPIPMFALYANSSLCATNEPLLVILDARLNQIYVALIDTTNFSYLIQPSLINPDELSTWLTKSTMPSKLITVTGNGWNIYQDKIPEECKQYLTYTEQNYPSANVMLELINKNHFQPCNINEADLLYIRNKVALNLEEQIKSKQI